MVWSGAKMGRAVKPYAVEKPTFLASAALIIGHGSTVCSRVWAKTSLRRVLVVPCLPLRGLTTRRHTRQTFYVC